MAVVSRTVSSMLYHKINHLDLQEEARHGGLGVSSHAAFLQKQCSVRKKQQNGIFEQSKIFLNKQARRTKVSFFNIIPRGRSRTPTIQKISFLSHASTPQRYTLVWLASCYIHKMGSSRLQHAGGGWAEMGGPFYCYTLTRKNLEVKHHRETDGKREALASCT